MEITLDKAGFLAKYYEWTFKKEVPNWLCPYFWVIVFLVVLFPVVLVTKLIIYLIGKFNIKYKQVKVEKVEKIMSWVGTTIFILLFLSLGFLGYSIILVFIKYGLLDFLKMLSVFIIIFGFYSLLIILFDKLVNKISNSNSKTHSMIIEMIKALYHKVCPHINWIDSRNTNKNSENKNNSENKPFNI